MARPKEPRYEVLSLTRNVPGSLSLSSWIAVRAQAELSQTQQVGPAHAVPWCSAGATAWQQQEKLWNVCQGHTSLVWHNCSVPAGPWLSPCSLQDTQQLPKPCWTWRTQRNCGTALVSELPPSTSEKFPPHPTAPSRI